MLFTSKGANQKSRKVLFLCYILNGIILHATIVYNLQIKID